MALVLSALSTQQEYFWPLSSAGTIFQPTVTVYISRGCCFHAFISAWVRFCATSWTLLWHIVICCLFRLIQSNWHLGVLLYCICCAESYPGEKDPARCSLQTTEKTGRYSGYCFKKRVLVFWSSRDCFRKASYLSDLNSPVRSAVFYYLEMIWHVIK